MPAMRFIGVETGCEAGVEERGEILRALDVLADCASGFDYDVLLMHHYGSPVDAEGRHCFLGRFMKADTPVPAGFTYIEFVPEYDFKPGAPYMSQFAFAVFSGSDDALHKKAGFDYDAMYDITRNMILGENMSIPYPEKYWTAEVMLTRGNDGAPEKRCGYLFSVDLNA